MSNFQVNTPSYQYGALWHSPCLSDCGSMNQDEYCCSVTESCLTLSDPMNCSTSGFPVLHYLLELAQTQSIESVMPSNHLNPFSSCPQSFPEFSDKLTLCIKWPRYWSLGFSISPSNEYSGLIFFRID